MLRIFSYIILRFSHTMTITVENIYYRRILYANATEIFSLFLEVIIVATSVNVTAEFLENVVAISGKQNSKNSR